MPMKFRISFDLDDTLVPPLGNGDVPRDPCGVPLLLRRFFPDSLRAGARALLHQLADKGIELWVYTSSNRSERAIRTWWWLQGLPRLGGVVNGRKHWERMRLCGIHRPPTKAPALWNIDLHVDDCQGVKVEQVMHCFSGATEVLVVELTDIQWTDRVVEAVQRKLRATSKSKTRLVDRAAA
jgi:hypothetical protein